MSLKKKKWSIFAIWDSSTRRAVLSRSPCAVIQLSDGRWRCLQPGVRKSGGWDWSREEESFPLIRLLTGLLSESVRAARAVLEGSHLHAPTQPLHLQLTEVVFFVVLNDNLLQLPDLSLHFAPQLPFHLVQRLEKETMTTNVRREDLYGSYGCVCSTFTLSYSSHLTCRFPHAKKTTQTLFVSQAVL